MCLWRLYISSSYVSDSLGYILHYLIFNGPISTWERSFKLVSKSNSSFSCGVNHWARLDGWIVCQLIHIFGADYSNSQLLTWLQIGILHRHLGSPGDQIYWLWRSSGHLLTLILNSNDCDDEFSLVDNDGSGTVALWAQLNSTKSQQKHSESIPCGTVLIKYPVLGDNEKAWRIS